MAKKFGKFLLFSAAVGAVGAAAYYYLQKKDEALFNDADEDYDDFSVDPEDNSSSRTYVPLNHEEFDGNAPKSDDDTFTPLAEKLSKVVENVKNEVKEKVEDFFDEDTSKEDKVSAEEPKASEDEEAARNDEIAEEAESFEEFFSDDEPSDEE